MTILVTGGTGYIGSHTTIQLLEQGYNVIIIDNLCNSSRDVLDQIEKITKKKPLFFEVDLKEENQINQIFLEEEIDAVIHFASLKIVSESVQNPLKYYENNIMGTINLLKCMENNSVKKLIFSSSAAVYGNQDKFPIKENVKLNAVNPYGITKLVNEQILKDIYKANSDWNVVILRYFNPIGAHPSGLIGDSYGKMTGSLISMILNVAAGEESFVNIYGNNFKTKDGTCIRDFIHVMDVAEGHIAALKKLASNGLYIYNLGTGKGYSVLELIKSFEKVNHCKIPYQMAERRQGDIVVSYADVTKAKNELNWAASRTIEDMCKDSWNYFLKNQEFVK